MNIRRYITLATDTALNNNLTNYERLLIFQDPCHIIEAVFFSRKVSGFL